MTYEQIIALTDKGFTPDQIMQLSNMETDPEPDQPNGAEVPPDPAPDPEGHDGPADPDGETPPPYPDPLAEIQKSMKEMAAELSAMKAAQQEANIKDVIRPAPEAKQTADDILAGFIRPEMKGDKNK